MRLIDADALTEHMRKAYEGNKKNGFKWDLECTVAVIACEEEINQPIVRCKDCKFWEVDNDVGFCVRTEDCDWNADDFCSRGERKDDNKDKH